MSELWEQPILARRELQRGSTARAVLSLLLASFILAEALTCFPPCGDALPSSGMAPAGIGGHGALRSSTHAASIVSSTPHALRDRPTPSLVHDLDCTCRPVPGSSDTSAPDTPADHLHPHEHVAVMTAIVPLLAAALLQPRLYVATRTPVSLTPIPPLRPPLQPSR